MAGSLIAATVTIYGDTTVLHYDVTPTQGIIIPPDGGVLAPGATTLVTEAVYYSLATDEAFLVYGSSLSGTLSRSTLSIIPPTPPPSQTTSSASSASPTSNTVLSLSSGSSTTLPSSLFSQPISSNRTTSAGPKSTSTTAPNHSGVSKGATAGIGVGCAIAGTAIAFLLFWFFKRKSNNRHQTPDQEARTAAFPHQEKQPAVSALPLDNANFTTRTVENNLPQPLEDNTIAEAISKISNSIKNHVQSYYHSARVSAGAVNLDALQALGDGLPISIGILNTMLANPTTRETAIRLCIAWVVVSRIQFGGDPRITFLPPEVTSCINSMTGLDSKPQVRTAFLSKWRILTAELMQTTYGGNAFSANDPRNHNILQAVEVLDAVLRPYTDERVDNNQRRRNLEEILKRAAGFAFMLFSQPSSWKFEWENPHGQEPGSIVIFPALVQIVDETGRSLSPPRAFSEVVVRQIDG